MATQAPDKTRVLRIKVVDHNKEGSPAVNIKVPMGLVKFGLKMAQTYSPEVKKADLDWGPGIFPMESIELRCYCCSRPIESGPVLGNGKLHCSFECANQTGRREGTSVSDRRPITREIRTGLKTRNLT